MLACALAAAGCGGSDFDLAPVRGRVSDRGQAVPGASVTFQPISNGGGDAGPASFGITDAEGRFELRTFNKDRPGAVVGSHRVYISLAPRDERPDDQPAPPVKNVPPRFQDGTTTLEVPSGGVSDSEFDLAQS